MSKTNNGANLGFESHMWESVELDAVIRKNLEVLGYGE
jgi:hypothetical protein